MIAAIRWWLWRHFAWYRRRWPIALRCVNSTISFDSPAAYDRFLRALEERKRV